jgi:hypothetical protein
VDILPVVVVVVFIYQELLDLVDLVVEEQVLLHQETELQEPLIVVAVVVVEQVMDLSLMVVLVVPVSSSSAT